MRRPCPGLSARQRGETEEYAEPEGQGPLGKVSAERGHWNTSLARPVDGPRPERPRPFHPAGWKDSGDRRAKEEKKVHRRDVSKSLKAFQHTAEKSCSTDAPGLSQRVRTTLKGE